MTDRYVTLAGAQTLNPGPILESAADAGFPIDFAGKASSIRCPLGTNPGSAFFIVSNIVAQALTTNAPQQISWWEGPKPTIFKNYYLHSAKAVGADGDGQTAYLIELRDKRAILWLSCINKRYNMNQPSSHYIDDGGTITDKYYADSLNSGALFTWAQAWSDIWTQLPSAIAGTAPTLPYAPGGKPKNLIYCGMPTMRAVARFLAAIGCALKLDPLQDQLTIVRLGSTQQGLTDAIKKQASNRLFDNRPKLFSATTIPEKIRVCFPAQRARNEDHSEPAYTVDKDTSVSDAIAGTLHVLWDVLPAQYASDSGSISNTTELDDRATEIAANYVQKLQADVANGYLRLRGLVTSILPGEQVSEIVWRDYSDGLGLITEVYQDNVAPQYPERADFNMQRVIRFQLTEDLTSSSANAVFLDSTMTPTADTLTVYDPLGIYNGMTNGKKGYARYMSDTEHFEICDSGCL